MSFIFLFICTHSLNGCIFCFITYAIVTKDILHVIVKPFVGNYIQIFHSFIKFYVQVVGHLLCFLFLLIINLKVFYTTDASSICVYQLLALGLYCWFSIFQVASQILKLSFFNQASILSPISFLTLLLWGYLLYLLFFNCMPTIENST